MVVALLVLSYVHPLSLCAFFLALSGTSVRLSNKDYRRILYEIHQYLPHSVVCVAILTSTRVSLYHTRQIVLSRINFNFSSGIKLCTNDSLPELDGSKKLCPIICCICMQFDQNDLLSMFFQKLPSSSTNASVHLSSCYHDLRRMKGK
jgi:hypothetical protein